MNRLRFPARLIGALLLAAAAAMAPAQRTDIPLRNAERAADAAARVQDRAARAEDRAAAAQDRSSRALQAFDRAASQDGLSIAAMARARSVANAHFNRLRELVKANAQFLELVDDSPAVRGEIVAVDPHPTAIAAARMRGYNMVADELVEGLDSRFVTLRVPRGKPLKKALAELRRIAPTVEFAANHIYVQSGSAAPRTVAAAAVLAPSSPVTGPAIGIIDGGVAHNGRLARLEQRGFAAGAPAPDAHATAVASLASATRAVRSASPGAPLLIADIYGTDPKGGNSLALARALGWLAKREAPVVLISLVGPANPIVSRAIRQVQARGIHVLAPVGNAGPAAPPMFPASYPGVIGITGVDKRNRALIEAGRGPQVDYAAPGADILAAAPGGGLMKVRGTSYAVPLVAGRLWLASLAGDSVAALDRQAVDLGRKGRDRIFGQGLICGECR